MKSVFAERVRRVWHTCEVCHTFDTFVLPRNERSAQNVTGFLEKILSHSTFVRPLGIFLSRFAPLSHIMSSNIPTEDFESLLAGLRRRDVQAWSLAVGQMRQVTLPWLRRRVGRLPSYALVEEQEFVLEIFADSLAKFYDLFDSGNFGKAADMQSLMFRVAELKMKEAFARLQKDALIYRPASPEAFEVAVQKQPDWTADDDLARERAVALQQQFATLEADERDLLQRFYSGEKMSRLAQELGLTEENLRKRKQRALDRLKQLMKLTVNLLCILWNL